MLPTHSRDPLGERHPHTHPQRHSESNCKTFSIDKSGSQVSNTFKDTGPEFLPVAQQLRSKQERKNTKHAGATKDNTVHCQTEKGDADNFVHW